MTASEPLRSDLCFVKLGGSLITEKDKPHTPRPNVIARLAAEIAGVLQNRPDLRIVLGHGSGSFGHVPARKYATRQGVQSAEDWQGFAEVWREASQLNRLVMDALAQAGLPSVAFPPSASVWAEDGKIIDWILQPLKAALQSGLLPVVFGDVVFDRQRGGTILSTEDLFMHLAKNLKPARMILAGIEPGVWADYPACTQYFSEITPDRFESIQQSLGGSAAVDVTGGMLSKVTQSLALAAALPGLEVLIFTGENAGNLAGALEGQNLGTRIWSP